MNAARPAAPSRAKPTSSKALSKSMQMQILLCMYKCRSALVPVWRSKLKVSCFYSGGKCVFFLSGTGDASVRRTKVVAVAQSKLTFIKPTQTGTGRGWGFRFIFLKVPFSYPCFFYRSFTQTSDVIRCQEHVLR